MLLGALIHSISAFFFALIAILLMMVILLQRGRGVGLSGAFGGAGGGGGAFGAKTGDILTWITIAAAGVLLVFAIALNYVFQPSAAGLAPQPAPAPATTTDAPGSQPAGALLLPLFDDASDRFAGIPAGSERDA